VGNEPGIEVVRIYNKRGEITFSSTAKEVGTIANLGENACSGCHTGGTTAVSVHQTELTRMFDGGDGKRILGMITPIKNEATCAAAGCHASPSSQTILGILDVMVPLDELDRSLSDLRRVQVSSAIAMVVLITFLAGLFIWRMVTVPVRTLTKGMEEIRQGNLTHRISLKKNDEIGVMADSFNHMTAELQRAQAELTDWNRTLEERVREKTEELGRAHSHMVHMEKMVSLGTLAATVAHELNNPLEGILTYAKLLKRKIDRGIATAEAKQEIIGELSMIADETARCGNIVKNLLLFSRQKVGEFRTVELSSIIDRSVKLIEHHLKMNNVVLHVKGTEQPVSLVCDPHQIEQALLALEINAVEAMPGGGSMTLEVHDGTDSVRIDVIDTGIGIRDEDAPHIFEPFYTTKRDGKGTGLGLSVVYGIIERHGGNIDMTSVLQKGTTFSITLPKTERQPGVHT
jgi:two-component system NtrC family sensor kinase